MNLRYLADKTKNISNTQIGQYPMANSNRNQRGPHLKEHHEEAVEFYPDVVHCFDVPNPNIILIRAKIVFCTAWECSRWLAIGSVRISYVS
ncbi:unnamed protein product [Rhizophagus irregularis]|uniref:Uncharacterized protein n=1 Tax=Rhizophagus irregularis TaxID=588596 RepID=A0A916E9D5_9GLOM|nr:unnamed protein product [Rhizophagus irregularis]